MIMTQMATKNSNGKKKFLIDHHYKNKISLLIVLHFSELSDLPAGRLSYVHLNTLDFPLNVSEIQQIQRIQRI